MRPYRRRRGSPASRLGGAGGCAGARPFVLDFAFVFAKNARLRDCRFSPVETRVPLFEPEPTREPGLRARLQD